MSRNPPFRKELNRVATNEQTFQFFGRHKDNPQFDPLSGMPCSGEWFEIEASAYHFMQELLPPLSQRTGMFGLPPITTWLNRLLALRIESQNLLFEVFEQLMRAKIEGAISADSYDKGVETIKTESITVTDRRKVYTHPVSGAQSHVLTVARKDRIRPLGLADALAISRAEPQSVLLANRQSSCAAIQLPTASLILDDGTIEHRVRLLRPRLKARGLISEIFSWKLRLSTPIGGQGSTMLASLIEHHTLIASPPVPLQLEWR